MATPSNTPTGATGTPTTTLEPSERTRCEVWSRVMGYHRPVAAWNNGKRAEHADRRNFTEARAQLGTEVPGTGAALLPLGWR